MMKQLGSNNGIFSQEWKIFDAPRPLAIMLEDMRGGVVVGLDLSHWELEKYQLWSYGIKLMCCPNRTLHKYVTHSCLQRLPKVPA